MHDWDANLSAQWGAWEGEGAAGEGEGEKGEGVAGSYGYREWIGQLWPKR